MNPRPRVERVRFPAAGADRAAIVKRARAGGAPALAESWRLWDRARESAALLEAPLTDPAAFPPYTPRG